MIEMLVAATEPIESLVDRDIEQLEATIRTDARRLDNLRAASEAIAAEIGLLSLGLNDSRQRLKWALEAKAAEVGA